MYQEYSTFFSELLTEHFKAGPQGVRTLGVLTADIALSTTKGLSIQRIPTE